MFYKKEAKDRYMYAAMECDIMIAARLGNSGHMDMPGVVRKAMALWARAGDLEDTPRMKLLFYENAQIYSEAVSSAVDEERIKFKIGKIENEHLAGEYSKQGGIGEEIAGIARKR